MDIYPSLTYRDLETALQDLAAAFGLETKVEARDGAVIRLATLTYGEGAILVQPELPDELHGAHAGRAWTSCESTTRMHITHVPSQAAGSRS